MRSKRLLAVAGGLLAAAALVNSSANSHAMAQPVFSEAVAFSGSTESLDAPCFLSDCAGVDAAPAVLLAGGSGTYVWNAPPDTGSEPYCNVVCGTGTMTASCTEVNNAGGVTVIAGEPGPQPGASSNFTIAFHHTVALTSLDELDVLQRRHHEGVSRSLHGTGDETWPAFPTVVGDLEHGAADA